MEAPKSSSEVPRPPERAAPSGPGPFALLVGILFRPAHTWAEMRRHEVPVGRALWPHAVVLVLLRAGAELVRKLIEGVAILDALQAFLLSAGAWILLVLLFAVVALTVASAQRGHPTFGNAVRYAAFGLTPLFLVGMLSVFPFPYVGPAAEALAMPYTFYVLAVGVTPMLGVAGDRAPGVVGMLNGALVLGWALLPTLLSASLIALGTGSG